MAIELNIENSQYGIPFAAAYFRIVTAAVTRQREDSPRHSVMIDVAGYATKPGNEDTKEIDFRRYHVAVNDVESMSGETFMERCYTWVMSQADMTGSIGV